MSQEGYILSIITVCYNDLQGLKRTLDSVADQTFRDFEHIVIDGGSTDGAAEFLKQSETRFTYWISEKDKGVYDAQNKGIKKATGKYLLFLNSGDTLFNKKVLQDVVSYMAGEADVIYGNSNVVATDGTSEILIPPAHPDLYFWYRKTINHQAAFMKRMVFDKLGFYSLNYRICSDYEMFLKAFTDKQFEFLHIPVTVCNYYEGGFSTKPENYELVMEERDRIMRNVLPRRDYLKIKKAYIRSLPVRKQILTYIYQTPVISSVFKTVYPLISAGARKKK